MASKKKAEAISQYDDLLCRCSLTDTGTIPRTPPLEASPDVIPSGSTPVADPALHFKETYEKNVAQPVVGEQENLIYVRGKNLAEYAQNGDVYVYWARKADLNKPSTWKNNQLMTTDGKGSFPLLDVEPEAIAVATTPFTWTPGATLDNQDVVLIGVLATNDHPNPVPSLRSTVDFNVWVSKRGGVGAFTTKVHPKPKPQTKVTLNGDFKFAEGGIADVLITATEVPVGTYVSLELTTPVDGNIIKIPPTEIKQSPQTIGVQANFPPNYSSQIVTKIAVTPGAVPGANNSVLVRAQYTPPSTEGGPVKPVVLARYSIHFDA